MPTRMTQQDKAFLNLAGEFAVASELNRRHILASVTYGASKCADVFALSHDLSRVVRIEVKAHTAPNRARWLIGAKGTKQSNGSDYVFWVLVRFPTPVDRAPKTDAEWGQHAARFFVMSQQEIYDAWQIEYKEFIERRGGKPFTGRGVPGVRLKDIGEHEGKWQKIRSALNV